MGPAPKVLIVEDDWMIGDHLKVVLEGLGYAVCGLAASADDAVKLAREEQPAVILMDVRLQGPRDGIEAVTEIRRLTPVPVVFVTASSDSETLARIRASGRATVLFKPLRRGELKEVLARVCPLP
jgi:two-component system, response regulator PdtaR